MNKLNYALRNKILLISILVISYLTFTQSILVSIDTFFKVKENTHFISSNSSIKKDIVRLSRQKSEKVSSIDSTGATENYNDEPLTLISQICESNKLLIWRMAPTVEHTQEDLIVQNRSYTINGSYKDLLFLIRHLELNLIRSKIVSINYQIDRNQRNSSPKLLCEIVFKKVVKNEKN